MANENKNSIEISPNQLDEGHHYLRNLGEFLVSTALVVFRTMGNKMS